MEPRYAVIVDIDGTLSAANPSDKEWWNLKFDKETEEKVANEPVNDIVASIIHQSTYLPPLMAYPIFLTGREEKWRNATVEFINRAIGDIDYELHMRPDDDCRSDEEVKSEILYKLVDGYSVVFAIDDSIQNFLIFEKFGIPCILVDIKNEPVSQDNITGRHIAMRRPLSEGELRAKELMHDMVDAKNTETSKNDIIQSAMSILASDGGLNIENFQNFIFGKRDELAVRMRAGIALVSAEVGAMLLAKNRRYANSVVENVGIFSNANPLEAMRIRMDDKLRRIQQSHSAEGDTEDAMLDLIGYLILYRAATRVVPDFEKEKSNANS